jgi:hypothetical protein
VEYFIFIKTSKEGSFVNEVGIRKVTPQDRILGITPFPILHPPPEILQALKKLIEQAQKEGLD